MGFEVKGPAIVSLVENVKEAFGGEREIDGAAGDGHAGGARNDQAGLSGGSEAIEVELNARGGLLFACVVEAAQEAGDFGIGVDEGKRVSAFDGEEVSLGREDDGYNATVGVEEGMLDEGLARVEVGEWCEGGEAVAEAEEELSVAEVPEVLAVIVDEHLGAGEEAAGGEFDEQEIDVVILIGRGIVGDAGNEVAGVEGDEEMSGIHIVQGEHGAAVEQIAGGQGHEADVLKRDSGGWAGAGSEECCGQDEAEECEEQEQSPAEMAARMAAGMVEWREGNRHSVVSVHPNYLMLTVCEASGLPSVELRVERSGARIESCLALLFHRRIRVDNGWQLPGK